MLDAITARLNELPGFRSTVRDSKTSPTDAEAIVRRWRRVVLIVAVCMLIPKVIVAATTYGTNDIHYWHDFAKGVAERGPFGVYGINFQASLYNHPPLIGYYLVVVNQLRNLGLSIQFTIRTVSSLADVASSLLIFELLRRRRPLREAVLAALLVAASPVLFIISAFHGNNDPVFTMLVLLSVYLLADRSRPGLSGIALGLAIGVKIVPVLVLPALLVYAMVKGRTVIHRFGAGFAITVLITWGPAWITHGTAVENDVLDYSGSDVRQWGLEQLGHWMGDPGWTGWLVSPGRFLIVLLCALVPAWLVWRRPEMIAEAVGLALCAFLFLSPAFATQYFVWAVAASYLLTIRWATAYNIAAGVTLFIVYNRWSGGLPWNDAVASPYTSAETVDVFLVWLTLGFAIAWGLVRVWGGPTCPLPVAARDGSRSRPVNSGFP